MPVYTTSSPLKINGHAPFAGREHPHKLPALAYPDVAEFARAVGIGRTQAYEEIKAGRLRVAKVGRRTIVAVAEAEQWLAARMGDAAGDAA